MIFIMKEIIIKTEYSLEKCEKLARFQFSKYVNDFTSFKDIRFIGIISILFLIIDFGILIFSHKFSFIIFIISLITYIYSFIYRKKLIEANKEKIIMLHKNSIITISSKNVNINNGEIDMNINYNSICVVYDVKKFIYINFIFRGNLNYLWIEKSLLNDENKEFINSIFSKKKVNVKSCNY
ncbi:MAG: hypothetical protein NC483_06545 [Ruminococcus sp.]|nr:hypothetical protein [Ruminococcus sp.]